MIVNKASTLWFQFQTGSIKSLCYCQAIQIAKEERSFNSKLVRLKGSLQSITKDLSNPCFNSKLVRLKGRHIEIMVLIVEKEFQFQTGSIKS